MRGLEGGRGVRKHSVYTFSLRDITFNLVCKYDDNIELDRNRSEANTLSTSLSNFREKFLVNDQRDVQFFYVFIYIFNSLHVSSTSCSSSGETNCVNATSGSCHSVSVAVSCAGRKLGG